ncbi:MAG: phosphatidate cytidylyltransferase [Clostridiales bacterium]|nr:phosphatidate cytidylyltransferase [Clostridiales bacterium]
MKQRVITAVLLLLVLALCIWQVYTPVLTAVAAFLSAVASYEIMKCAKVQNKFILVLGTVFSACVQFLSSPLALEGVVSGETWGSFIELVPLKIYVIIFVLLVFLAMLADYPKIRFEAACVSIVASVIVPLVFSVIVRLRDMFAGDERQFGVYLVFFALISALGTDVGAQLGGMAFGKHKMCPKISPKKTVEGAVCGVITAFIMNVAAFFIYQKITGSVPENALVVVLICSVPVSFMGMMGDLTASVLKRNFKIKDFGKIFPGHGGVMDRFDSSLFTLALTYAVAVIAF